MIISNVMKINIKMLRNCASIAVRCSYHAYYSTQILEFLSSGTSFKDINVETNGYSLTIYETTICINGDNDKSLNTYIIAFQGTDERIDWKTKERLL